MLTALCVTLVNSYDNKSALALFIPASISLLLAALRLRSREPRVKAIVVSLGLFLLCLVLSPSEFLNVTFFYFLALLLLVLFVNEIQAYSNERQAHLEEQARANKLQTIIEQNSAKHSAETITVGSANKLEVVKINDIVYCKGAGDYIELALSNGQSLLHSERLTEMEAVLPSVFLRVHRSYIVNSALITKTIGRRRIRDAGR